MLYNRRVHAYSASKLEISQSSHADLCPLPKVLIMDTWALDHAAMEEGLIHPIFFVNGWAYVSCLAGEEMARVKAVWSSLGKTWVLVFHVDVTLTHAFYLNIIAEQGYSLIALAPFSRIMCPETKQKLFSPIHKSLTMILAGLKGSASDFLGPDAYSRAHFRSWLYMEHVPNFRQVD